MRGIETGRAVLGYISKTAKEISGVGSAQRFWREEATLATTLGEKPDVGRMMTYGALTGLMGFLAPLSTRAHEQRKPYSILILNCITDAVVVLAVYDVSSSGHPEAVLVKIGYNTLVQIAPDVAKLAKSRVFQKAK